MTPLPTDLAQIAGITDNLVLRNLLITQRYHDLSRALAETMGNDRDVNWSTFATWASKTAGLSIRDEEVSLALPGGATLPLGADIPPSAAARPYLPPALRDIGAPPALVEVLARFDRARGDTDVGSASIDWRKLPDRMNFIVNLFRSRQQEWSLMDPPFNDAQRQAIEGGQVPSPSLGKL